MTRYTLCETHRGQLCPVSHASGMNVCNVPHDKKLETKGKKSRSYASRINRKTEELPPVHWLIDEIGLRRSAALCGVHRTTALRWKHGKVRAPASAVAVLYSALTSNNPGPQWQGWKLSGEFFISPAGDKFTPGDILAGPWERAALASAQAKIQKLESQLIAATRAAAAVDVAGNDSAIWPGDVRSKAFR
jgi:hypothetical protein